MKIKGEISFDILDLEQDNMHLEGCYRLEGKDWNIFYLTHCNRGELWEKEPDIRAVVWPSGIPGIDGMHPANQPLNKETARKILSEALGKDVDWTEVHGPDSLQMK